MQKCKICNLEKEINCFDKNKKCELKVIKICKQCKSINRKRKHVHIKDNLLLCLTCFIYKTENQFDVNNKNAHRLFKDRRCKCCKQKQTLKRKQSNRGKQDLDRILLERWHGLKLRSEKKNHTIDFDYTYLKQLWEKQNGLCALSGVPMTYIMNKGRIFTNVSVDKINPLSFYFKDNIQLVCMAVNQMKSDMNEDELLYFCKQIIKLKDETK